MFWQQGLVTSQVEGNLETGSPFAGLFASRLKLRLAPARLAAERQRVPNAPVPKMSSPRSSRAVDLRLLGALTEPRPVGRQPPSAATSVATLAGRARRSVRTFARPFLPAWLVDEVETRSGRCARLPGAHNSRCRRAARSCSFVLRHRLPRRAAIAPRGCGAYAALLPRPSGPSLLRRSCEWSSCFNVKTTRGASIPGRRCSLASPCSAATHFRSKPSVQPADLDCGRSSRRGGRRSIARLGTDFADAHESPQVDLKADPVRFRSDISVAIRVQGRHSARRVCFCLFARNGRGVQLVASIMTPAHRPLSNLAQSFHALLRDEVHRIEEAYSGA